MSQISRLRDDEISNGNLINADDIDLELNQLVSEANAQDLRVTDLETNNITIVGVKTFSSPIKVSSVESITEGSGLEISSVSLSSGSIVLGSNVSISNVNIGTDELTTLIVHQLLTASPVKFISEGTLPPPLSASVTYYARVVDAFNLTLHPSPSDAVNNSNRIDITGFASGEVVMLLDPPVLSEGQLWFNQPDSSLKVYSGGVTRKILTDNDLSSYWVGPPVRYSSSDVVNIPSGFSARDKNNFSTINVQTDITVNLSVSGKNGLDTGTQAADTWYYLYLLADSTGVSEPAAVFSVTNEASSGNIVFPAGYDLRRQLPIAIRNNSTSDIVPFVVAGAWPNQPLILYDVTTSHWLGGSLGYHQGETNFLAAASASAWTSASAAAFIPPISKVAILNGFLRSQSVFSIRPSDTSGEAYLSFGDHAGGSFSTQKMIRVDAAQSYDYQRVDGSQLLDLDIVGFYVTEVQ